MIYPEHMNFLHEARKAFEEDEKLETYRDENDEFIALRRGQDRDCVQIYKLDGEVAFFAQVLSYKPF